MRDKRYKSMRVTVLGDKPIITQQDIDKADDVKVQFENLVVNLCFKWFYRLIV